MGDDGRFEPTPEQHEWLDPLSPERRHEVSKALHAHWYTLRRNSENLDKMVDLLLGCQPQGRAFDQLTEMVLKAEGQYHLDPGDIRITILDRPQDE